MENIFRPGKWLVLFCGVFVLLWATLQYVSNQRLKEEAEATGKSLFTWAWPGPDNWASEGTITAADILQKSDHDALVRVSGKQTLKYYNPRTTASLYSLHPAAGPAEKAWAFKDQPVNTETMDCSALLTFYKMSEKNKDYWVLGKVEFPN